MPEITLTADAGRTIGSSSTRRLRADGKIPGVVYGHGTEPDSGGGRGPRVPDRHVRRGRPEHAAQRSSWTARNHLTLARDIQHHPVENVVTHVDFLIVRRDEVIAAEVTINLVGEALEVAATATASSTSSCSPCTSRPSRPTSRRRGPRHHRPDHRRLAPRLGPHHPRRASSSRPIRRHGGGRQPPRVQAADEELPPRRAEGEAAAPAGEADGRRGLTPAPPPRGAGRPPPGHPLDLLVVGLGNPGAEFEGTRHNVGADAVALPGRAATTGRLRAEKGLHARAGEIRIGGQRVLCAVPTTYMNESGLAVAPLVRRAGLDGADGSRPTGWWWSTTSSTCPRAG